MSVDLTILMPCLNEAKTLDKCILQAKQGAEKLNRSYEILIADNGSVDNSVEIAKKSGARVIIISEKGYGNALIGGIKAACGKYIIMGDCDLSYDFTELGEFVDKLEQGAALVVGNRFTGNMEKGAMPFWHKYFGVPLLSFLGRVRFKTDVKDFHCGIRAFDREKALKLNLSCSGMEFATEIIGKFAASGEKILQIPSDLRCDGRNGKSHLRSIRDGLRHLCFILFYR